VAKSLFWVRAPKPVATLAYAIVGLSAVPFLPRFAPALGPAGLALILGGSALYLLGALAYVFRRPNPVAGVFGYHEVFHSFVVLAAACHFLAIRALIVSQ
jgi:hemolysin III